MKKEGFVHLFALGIALFVLLGTGVFWYYTSLQKPKLLTTRDEIEKQTSLAQDPKEIVSIKKTYLALKNNHIIVAVFQKQGSLKFARWNDSLFFSSGAQYSDPAQLNLYNLNTGEIKVLFKEEKSNRNRYINDIQILNNTLFFSTGGFLAGGGTYYLDLPVVNSTKKIVDGPNGGISFDGTHYWLRQGEGDGCGGGAVLSTLDINTKRIVKVAEMGYGCADGEEDIGFDNQNRLILAYHNDFMLTEKATSGIYQYIVAVHIDDPSIKDGIIAKQDMPKNVFEVKYDKASDNIYLRSSDGDYVFNLKIKKIEKGTLPSGLGENYRPQTRNWDYSNANEMLKELKLPSSIKFELVDLFPQELPEFQRPSQ